MPEAKPEIKKEQAVKPEVKKSVTPKRKPIKKFFKSFVDVKKWSSYDEVSGNVKTTWGMFRRLFKRRDKEEIRNESYEEAIARMGLTEEQIAERKKVFIYSALIYGAFALALFIYLIYLLINVRVLATLMTIILLILMSVLTYRELFWYMQMTKKKLGCTFKDWVAFILRKEA